LTESDLPLLSVSGLNRLVSQAIGQKFPLVRLNAELSQVMQAASGHWYLTLKDSQASLRAVLFRREAASLAFRPAEGMQVELRVVPGLYEPKGEFQVRVLSMVQAGLGSLFEQFQRLKSLLEADGVFDPARKKAFPSRVDRIGVVTSLGAAALRDVLVTLTNHAPRLEVTVFPSLVQGAEAPAALLAALGRATHSEIDLLIIARGGGSLEDLWAFNDERLVRALAQCPVYTVAGVGHETDLSLVDLAADHRAATPTAAALWASQREEAFIQRLHALALAQANAIQRRLAIAQQQVDRAAMTLPDPRARLALQKLQWVRQAERFLRLGGHRLDAARSLLSGLSVRLHTLDPTAVLSRGYTLVFDAAGRPVVSIEGIVAGQPVSLAFADGKARARIEGIESAEGKPPTA
jgi:exodeoxyribonuclease VII large subunit